MSGDVNHHAIASFLSAGRSHVARALECLARYDEEPRADVPLDEVHEQLTALRHGAAGCGLTALEEVADIALAVLAAIRHGGEGPDPDQIAHLVGICHGVVDFLDACEPSRHDADAMLQELLSAARELRAAPATPASRSDGRATPEPAAGGLDADTAPALEVLPPDDVPSDLAEVFSAEAHDHLQTIARALRGYRDDPRGDHLRDLRRSVHTLKGAAGMVGFRAVSQLAHRVEDLLDQLFDRQLTPSARVVSLLFRSADLLEDLIDATSPDAELRAALAEIHEEHVAAYEEVRRSVATATGAEPGGAVDEKPDAHAPALEPSGRVRRDVAGHAPGERSLRVPLPKLDELVREVGELAVTRAAFEQYADDLAHQVAELQLSVRRLRRLATRLETEYEVLTLGDSLQRRFGKREAGQAEGEPEFDDLELDRYTDFHLISRELTETASDIGTLEQHLGGLRGEFDGSLARLGRVTRNLQSDFMALRLVPIAALRTRLERAVRVTAEQRGKAVDLEIEGEEHALDAAVIDQVADPLLHLLRNAVDHGIEPPGLRHAIGKPDCGHVRVRASREGDHVVIQVSDDGAGIDNERLRARAVARGFMTEPEALEATDEALRALLFATGFSTADEVSEVSGRGVGLDVVKARVEQMKGSVSVWSQPGTGTTFAIRLPLTLAVTRVLLVTAGNGTYAVQLAHVKEVRRVDRAVLAGLAQPTLDFGDRTLPVIVLADALGISTEEAGARLRIAVLDVEVEGRRIGLAVDDVLEARDAVFKPLGAQLSRVPCVAGATLLGTGQVVLILDLADVIRRPGDRAVRPRPLREPAPLPRRLNVMIVDDSLSVRRVLSGVVANAGWTSIQARDGLDALEILQRLPEPPDVMLVDIEMPRLDGFELTETLRGQDAFRAMPIVIITSRSGEKHRQRALAAGVTEYLVKPVQEDALVALIANLARHAPGEAA